MKMDAMKALENVHKNNYKFRVRFVAGHNFLFRTRVTFALRFLPVSDIIIMDNLFLIKTSQVPAATNFSYATDAAIFCFEKKKEFKRSRWRGFFFYFP